MYELTFRSSQIIDHSYELQYFFLQVGRETILHKEGSSRAKMVNKNACSFVGVVLKYRTTVVNDETVYSHLVLGCINILHRSLPLSRNLSQQNLVKVWSFLLQYFQNWKEYSKQYSASVLRCCFSNEIFSYLKLFMRPVICNILE